MMIPQPRIILGHRDEIQHHHDGVDSIMVRPHPRTITRHRNDEHHDVIDNIMMIPQLPLWQPEVNLASMRPQRTSTSNSPPKSTPNSTRPSTLPPIWARAVTNTSKPAPRPNSTPKQQPAPAPQTDPNCMPLAPAVITSTSNSTCAGAARFLALGRHSRRNAPAPPPSNSTTTTTTTTSTPNC